MYSSIFRLPVPVCSLNDELIIQECNQFWIQQFGAREYVGHSLMEFLPPRTDGKCNGEQISRFKNTTPTELLEFAITDMSGTGHPFAWAILYEPERKSYTLFGQSLSSHQAMETRWERMYQTTSDAVMLLDEDKFTDCNQATLNIFKVKSVDEFRKFHPADLSPPFQPDGESSFQKANRMIMKALSEGRNFFEWTHRNALGEDFPCEVLLSRIEVYGKSYLQASVRDISERVKFQKELDEARIQQMHASRLASLGEMAGGIAHEINNPMAIIRTQAELILNSVNRARTLDLEEIKLGMNRILTTSDRISRIIKGLKILSRDSGADPLIPGNLQTIIEDTLSFCEEKLKEKNIKFSLESKINDISILCRSVEISQVILNLITNSIDAIEDSASPWIKMEISTDNKMAILKVIDSGNGIPEAIAQKMTMPFYTTKEVGKGSGLGLSITKRIIEKHAGDFYLDRKSPNTTFVIKLPLAN